MPYTEKERCDPCCGNDEDPNPFPHWIDYMIEEIVAEPNVPEKPFFLYEASCAPTLVINPEDQVRPAAAVTHQVCVRQEVCDEPDAGPETHTAAEATPRPAAKATPAPTPAAKAKPAKARPSRTKEAK